MGASRWGTTEKTQKLKPYRCVRNSKFFRMTCSALQSLDPGRKKAATEDGRSFSLFGFFSCFPLCTFTTGQITVLSGERQSLIVSAQFFAIDFCEKLSRQETRSS